MLLSKVIQIFPEGRRDVVGHNATPITLCIIRSRELQKSLPQTRLKTHIDDVKTMGHKAT